MHYLRISAFLSFLACICLSALPVLADSPTLETVPTHEPEVECTAEAISNVEGLSAKDETYGIYQAKAALAQKASTNCSAAASMPSVSCTAGDGSTCKCNWEDGETTCECEADEDSCSCDCSWVPGVG